MTQYFLYDSVTGDIRQLTTDPNAIQWLTSSRACPRIVGTTPLISGDGSRVIVITSITMGLVPEDPSVGCYIFEYTVPAASWRYVTGLAQGLSLDSPVLSDDGRWLSFTSSRTVPPGIRRAFPALLDVETGALTDPLGGVADVPSFDSVITGDSSKVVISSQGDLDPQVGNADHNMELFLYDRAEETFAQVSQTVGGIGSTPGGCPNYRPVVNDDGSVILFVLLLYPDDGCNADGPQRSESNGLGFERVRAVRKRPGNHGPTLQAPHRVGIVAGYTLDLDLAAHDADGDPLTFFAQVVGGLNVPPGSEMQDHDDGTATLHWPTDTSVVGVHTVRVAAFDEGGGEVFQDVEITVRADSCAGDCDGNSHVTIDELVTGVRIALGQAPTNWCADFDLNGSESVTIDELVTAIRDSLNGCSSLTP